ncbi:MAG: MFS transporter [Planctomycetota bacterium]
MLSGSVGSVGRDFLHPELILAGMVFAVTRSWALTGLVAVVNKLGALGPQMAVGGHVEHLRRRRPFFLAIVGLLSVALAAMVLATWTMTRQVTGAALGLFFLAYLAVCALKGAGHVVFLDMVGRMIPPQRVGSFLGLRSLCGSVVAVFTGLWIVQPILAGVQLPTDVLPGQYLLLIGVGAALGVAEMYVFSLCREQDAPRAGRRTSLREALRRGVGWLKTDSNYRIYLLMRVAYRFNYLGLAFFVAYGSEKLGRRTGLVDAVILGGVMVAVNKLSRIAASGVWGRLADRYSYRVSLISAGVFFVLGPALTVLAPLLPEGFSLPMPVAGLRLSLPLLVYLLALLMIGMGMTTDMLGNSHFIIMAAPPHRRVSYGGFLNTVTCPLALLPLAGAWLAQTLGPTALFALLSTGGLAYLLGALRLKSSSTAARKLDTVEDGQ